MERFTISLEDELAEQFETFIQQRGYSNRSEAIRDLIRTELKQQRLQEPEQGHCIATLSYVYNHHESELASRVTSAHHAHHELTMATTHVHMDHDNCLEVTILKGPIATVREFADQMTAVRGVRHGSLNMVPVDVSETAHDEHGQTHTHHHPHI